MKKIDTWDYYKYNYINTPEKKSKNGNEIYIIDGKKYKWKERCYCGLVLGLI